MHAWLSSRCRWVNYPAALDRYWSRLLTIFAENGGADDRNRRPARYLPDVIETLCAPWAVPTRSRSLVEALERNGLRYDRPWMLAVGGRCRALWHTRPAIWTPRSSRPRRPWTITSGCRCLSNVPARSCCSANYSADAGAGRTPRRL